jgi:hypothetical protein
MSSGLSQQIWSTFGSPTYSLRNLVLIKQPNQIILVKIKHQTKCIYILILSTKFYTIWPHIYISSLTPD